MEKTFEENLKELETIVTKLESGEVGLDEALELYEKGIKLSAVCKERLETAKQKIETLN
mgnify:CR=1 FL=1